MSAEKMKEPSKKKLYVLMDVLCVLIGRWWGCGAAWPGGECEVL